MCVFVPVFVFVVYQLLLGGGSFQTKKGGKQTQKGLSTILGPESCSSTSIIRVLLLLLCCCVWCCCMCLYSLVCNVVLLFLIGCVLGVFCLLSFCCNFSLFPVFFCMCIAVLLVVFVVWFFFSLFLLRCVSCYFLCLFFVFDGL